jgi:hypothetical protein
MYCTFADSEFFCRLPYSGVAFYDIIGDFHGSFFNIIFQENPPANLVFTMYADGFGCMSIWIYFIVYMDGGVVLGYRRGFGGKGWMKKNAVYEIAWICTQSKMGFAGRVFSGLRHVLWTARISGGNTDVRNKRGRPGLVYCPGGQYTKRILWGGGNGSYVLPDSDRRRSA